MQRPQPKETSRAATQPYILHFSKTHNTALKQVYCNYLAIRRCDNNSLDRARTTSPQLAAVLQSETSPGIWYVWVGIMTYRKVFWDEKTQQCALFILSRLPSQAAKEPILYTHVFDACTTVDLSCSFQGISSVCNSRSPALQVFHMIPLWYGSQFLLHCTWDLCATHLVYHHTIKSVAAALRPALGAQPFTVIKYHCYDNQDIPRCENNIRLSGSSLHAEGVSYMHSVVWGVAAGANRETFVRFIDGSRPLQTEVKMIKALTSNTGEGLQKKKSVVWLGLYDTNAGLSVWIRAL